MEKDTNNNKNFDFNEYKKQVVEDDIKKVEKFINQKKKWYWFIPLVGVWIYQYYLGQTLTLIDRGILRKNITSSTWRWMPVDILFGIWFPALIFNYEPWKMKRLLDEAIRRTKRDMKND